MSARDDALDAIEAARQLAVSDSRASELGLDVGTPWFLGSGALLVATPQKMLAFSHTLGGDGKDRVLDKYGESYVAEALRKIGRAAVAAKCIDGRQTSPGHYTALMQVLLVKAGLTTEEAIPHHLGYEFGINTTGIHTVGASGMLPSEPVAEAMARTYATVLEMDRQRGWVDWEYDAFAGYHDLLAAGVTAGTIVGRRPPLQTVPSLITWGANLH